MRLSIVFANAVVTAATVTMLYLGFQAWVTYQRVNALWAWANGQVARTVVPETKPTPEAKQ